MTDNCHRMGTGTAHSKRPVARRLCIKCNAVKAYEKKKL